MNEHGEGRGPGRGSPKSKSKSTAKSSQPAKTQTSITELEVENLGQIEYLLYQSTQGVHLVFNNEDITRVLSQTSDEAEFFTEDNRKKVQSLLTSFLDAQSLQAKRSYLEHLNRADHDLLIRAYFHLVENMILAHSTIRH